MTEEMMEKFQRAFTWLDCHPDFSDRSGGFQSGGVGCLCTDVVKVNPKTNEIDDDESLNTEVQVWLEGGPWELLYETDYYGWSHDIDLDCGAATYEEAVIEFVALVRDKYGDYESQEV